MACDSKDAVLAAFVVTIAAWTRFSRKRRKIGRHGNADRVESLPITFKWRARYTRPRSLFSESPGREIPDFPAVALCLARCGFRVCLWTEPPHVPRLMRRRRQNPLTDRKQSVRGRPRSNRCVALLVIDNRPLQSAAWAELLRARKRLEKASKEIHRHEEKDEPGFRAWLTGTFSTLVSAVRDLAQQVESKGRLVQIVQSEAYFTGRSPASVWRAMQNRTTAPESHSDEPENGGKPPPWEGGPQMPDEEELEDEMKRLFEREGIDEDDPFAGIFRETTRSLFGLGAAESAEVADARAIYRRLVQQLHPDRGGEWTPARARLWDQVQQAWQDSDADWLARLEAEWEASTDVLGPTSALGRLRAACRELDHARRDAERRIRLYRKHPAWRFSLITPSGALHNKMERQLRQDEENLREQLDEIESAIAQWENPRKRKRRARTAGATVWQDGMPLF